MAPGADRTSPSCQLGGGGTHASLQLPLPRPTQRPSSCLVMLAPLRVWRRVSILESSRQSPAQTGPWFLPVPCPCSRGRESGRSCLRGSGKVGRTGPPSCFSRPHRGGRWLWLLPHQCPVPLGTGPHPAASLVLRAGPMRGQSWAPLGGGGGDGCGSHGQEDRTSGGCALPGPACTCACERGPGLCPPGGGAGSVQREGCHLPSSPPWGHPGWGGFRCHILSRRPRRPSGSSSGTGWKAPVHKPLNPGAGELRLSRPASSLRPP